MNEANQRNEKSNLLQQKTTLYLGLLRLGVFRAYVKVRRGVAACAEAYDNRFPAKTTAEVCGHDLRSRGCSHCSRIIARRTESAKTFKGKSVIMGAKEYSV
jgi:hypothetical protein